MSAGKKATKGKKKGSDSDSEEEKVPVRKASGAKKAAPAQVEEEEGHPELFVGNLSFDCDEDILRERFSHYGTLTKCKIPMRDGRSRGVGFVEFSSASEAKAALEAENGNELAGRNIKLSYSNDNGGDNRGTAPQVTGESTTVFCGNLGFRTEVQTIKEFFSGCGNV